MSDLLQGLISLLLLVAARGAPLADTYPRQPLDVEHYRFALTLADSTDRIVAEAGVRLRLLVASLTRVELDLADASAARHGRGMRVSAVTRNGKPLAFTHTSDRLAITLGAPSTAGELVELVVHYAGIPADGLLIKPNKHGDRTFFSDDWPNKARQWLPTIDHISDKATMEMDVVAPSHYQVISNGRRIEETDLPGGTRRTVWREAVPIAPWLYVLGVARFAVQHLGEYHGVPLETWVYAQDRDAGFHDFAVPVKDAVAFYSEFVGPYSYEKLANVQSNSVSGGMEAASAIFYSESSVSGTRSARWRNVVIHEIAHQWFGDAVTESDWNDVWLSEGFATYFTLLFVEHAYGRDEFTTGLRDSRKTVLDFYAKTPDYRVVHENLADMAHVTSAMTYQKGSWVLHMLRQSMGDDRFWVGIRDYYARYRDGNASTTDFRLAMERASGLDLSAFFQQWLYRGGVPRVEGTWAWDANAKQVVVELRQTQAGEPFRLPVEIGITAPGARVRVERVDLSGRSGRFTLAAEQEPASVELDPNIRLLVDGHVSPRPSARSAATDSTSPQITEADLRHRLFLIAADSMMGRESGSEGDFKTTEYIAAEFRRLGLEPAGDNGTYFQTVPFWRAAVDSSSALRVANATLEVGRDFLPSVFTAPPRTLSGVPTIYGGLATDSSSWITAEQAAGKVVVLDVPAGTPRRALGGAARWAGAAAVATVFLDQLGPETTALLRWGRPVPDTTRNPRVMPGLWVSRRAAALILGGDPATLAPGAAGHPISGRFDVARTPVPFPARNVVAVLRGSDPARRGEYVALTAHNDHVGFDRSPVDHDSLRAFNRVMRPMGADSPGREPTADEWRRIRANLDSLRRVNRPRPDSIRNGADDDGTGTVSILEIAEAMSRGRARPARSILFVSHTGEEAGLLGSAWFTDHATVPLDSVVAEIDQDMVGRGTTSDFPRGGTGAGSASYLEVVGAKRLSREFGDTLEAVNARQGVPFSFDYTYDAPGHPLQYYCRADHYNYARYGIPAVAFSRGEHLDYHQVTDEAQYISYPDLTRVSKMVHDAAMAIANMPVRPKLSVPKPTNPNVVCRQ